MTITAPGLPTPPFVSFTCLAVGVNLVLWPLPCDRWLAAALALTPPRTPALTCPEADWCGLSSSNFVQLHPGTSAWTLPANQGLYSCSCSVHVVCLLFYEALCVCVTLALDQVQVLASCYHNFTPHEVIFHLVRCTRFRCAVYLHLCFVKC